MSALLDYSTGRAGFAYHGPAPWHNEGKYMPANAPLEDWRVAAGLNWRVKESPVYAHISLAQGDVQPTLIKDRKALVRSDNHAPLSIVSKRYKYLQPKDALEFFRDLVEDYGFELATAGALASGRRIFVTARAGDQFSVDANGKDRAELFLLLATSYDGTFAHTAKFTSTYVVCNNTLNVAFEDGRDVIRISHLEEFNSADVKQQILGAAYSSKEIAEKARFLSEIKVSKEQAVRFFLEVFDEKDYAQLLDERHYTASEIESFPGRTLQSVKNALWAYRNAPGQELPNRRNTAWGLVNGVTYFTDHMRNNRSHDSRWDSNWFGDSARLKKRAVELAEKLPLAA